jgi:hypothetical protein
MVSFDFLQNSDVEILFAAEIAFDARHILHDQHVLALLMQIASGFCAQVLVAAKGASLSHVSYLVRRDS